MEFNTTKCEHLTLTRKRQNATSYTLHNTVMSKVSAVKYLGVKLQSSLRWNKNNDFITGKTASRLGYIRRSIPSSLPHLWEKGYKQLTKTYSWVCMGSMGHSYPKDPIESTWG